MERRETRDGGFGNGFLFGVIVGVLVALLFTTKKGKKLLQMITENGMDKMTSLENIFDELSEDYEEEATAPSEVEAAEPTVEEIESGTLVQSSPKELKPHRRFFKGISRRSVN